MKRKHIVAIIISLICTLAAIALVITVARLFFESAGFDPSNPEGDNVLAGVAILAILAVYQITISLIMIGVLNSIMALFLAASLIRKYSKKIDLLAFSLIGANGIMSLFFIGTLIIVLT